MWPIFKGFYTLEDAIEHAGKYLGHNFYIEENIPADLSHANFVLESQGYEEEIAKLVTKNAELTMELTSKSFEIDELKTKLIAKEKELTQMASEASDNNLMIERYRKKGIPYGNRSFECLQVRLKFPQFTCLTLQPLFETCPELEVIIAEKAKHAFYQKIIDLQNFLLSCYVNP